MEGFKGLKMRCGRRNFIRHNGASGKSSLKSVHFRCVSLAVCVSQPCWKPGARRGPGLVSLKAHQSFSRETTGTWGLSPHPSLRRARRLGQCRWQHYGWNPQACHVSVSLAPSSPPLSSSFSGSHPNFMWFLRGPIPGWVTVWMPTAVPSRVGQIWVYLGWCEEGQGRGPTLEWVKHLAS